MTHEISVEAQPYWDALSKEKLLLQQCGDCGAIRHYPRPMCAKCQSMAVAWTQACGRGTVHSWTITHQTELPGFKDRVPYALATVDLAEGVRMLAPLRSTLADALRAGMPVRIRFEKQPDETVIPVFVKVNPTEENA